MRCILFFHILTLFFGHGFGVFESGWLGFCGERGKGRRVGKEKEGREGGVG